MESLKYTPILFKTYNHVLIKTSFQQSHGWSYFQGSTVHVGYRFLFITFFISFVAMQTVAFWKRENYAIHVLLSHLHFAILFMEEEPVT